MLLVEETPNQTLPVKAGLFLCKKMSQIFQKNKTNNGFEMSL